MGENDFTIVILIGFAAIGVIAFLLEKSKKEKYKPKVIETSKRYSDELQDFENRMM